MSNFKLPEDQNTKVIEEAKSVPDVMKDASKYVLDVDIDDVKSAWKNSSNPDEYLKVIDDTGKKATDALGDLSAALTAPNKIDNRSLFARARNSLLQFPIYVSQSIRANEAHILSKMFERVYASLVQAVLAQNPIVNEEELNNMVFLKRFHTNIKESANVMTNIYYQPIDTIDEMLKESVFFHQQLTESCDVTFRMVNLTDQYLIQENARLMHEPLTGFPYLMMEANGDTDRKREDQEVQLGIRSGERMNIEQTKSEKILNDNDIIDIALTANDDAAVARAKAAAEKQAKQDYGSNIMDDIDKLNKKSPSDADYNDSRWDDAKAAKKAISDAGSNARKGVYISAKEIAAYKNGKLNWIRKTELDNIIDDWKKNVKDGNNKSVAYRKGQFVNVSTSTKRTIIDKKVPFTPAVDTPKLLKDVEIKKMNGMLPFPMEATFRVRLKNGNLDRDVKFLINVKSVLHLINPKDLGEDLREIVTGNIKKLQKVRYKTGEITFKDYMFNSNNIKKDAAKGIEYNKKWLNTLKRLAEFKKVNGALLKDPAKIISKGDIPIPNGTMILSQADVTTLTAETGIDLSVISNAKRMANSLFLIAIAIVDGSAGTMKVLFTDTDADWDIQSLAAIDAEIAKTDNSQIMRELNRMINR